MPTAKAEKKILFFFITVLFLKIRFATIRAASTGAHHKPVHTNRYWTKKGGQ
jgi:hypothetical protein